MSVLQSLSSSLSAWLCLLSCHFVRRLVIARHFLSFLEQSIANLTEYRPGLYELVAHLFLLPQIVYSTNFLCCDNLGVLCYDKLAKLSAQGQLLTETHHYIFYFSLWLLALLGPIGLMTSNAPTEANLRLHPPSKPCFHFRMLAESHGLSIFLRNGRQMRTWFEMRGRGRRKEGGEDRGSTRRGLR